MINQRKEVKMATPTLKFELTIEQVNGVLNVLGNAPYVQSASLIALLQEQASPQIQALQVEEAKRIAESANESTTATD